ncbi:Retrovirus-related Pol polyprotein from transposon TNT 1-94 [Dendrobium catenatum]|uniref:Retrovirus-related Pol polyprotein from transposon TNT 1-94 n=1 Tax=Dendrobium catenatum TaxID=906689 RepID=A0A2I0WCF0_9ASPA|nr:Retrovirus-related Pol polyprotein from transposon TNT 1-94 [Dendrobium catenatum]
MEDSSSSISALEAILPHPLIPIPPQLKFLITQIKILVSNPLTSENYPLWKSQVEKIFSANGFMGFLDGSIKCPLTASDIPHPDRESPYQVWSLLDQNLASALLSVISVSILPYVLSLKHCAEIWATLSHRLQASTRSRIVQLKNELYHLSKGDQSMTQYLLTVKSKVDAIVAAGSSLDSEEIIFHTLNGLPAKYQSFKSAIRTNLQPLSLDDLYTLLCSEELNLAHEASQELQSLQLFDSTLALAASRGKGRGRQQYSGRGRSSTQQRTNRSSNAAPQNSQRNDRQAYRNVICQICSKQGHSAVKCWYRHDNTYQETSHNQALFSPTDSSPQADWFLDTGASTHLTSNASHLRAVEPYHGQSQVTIGNGQQLPIQYTGKGILPTPSGKLQLNHLYQVPNLSFNLLSVSQLTRDNSCTVTFSSDGYKIKDLKTKRVLLQGPCHNGLYSVRSSIPTSNLALLAVHTVQDLWHSRLGHPDSNKLRLLAKHHSEIHTILATKNCHTCNLAKSKRLSFSNSTSTTIAPFDIIHSDVWGPSPTKSLNGFSYYVSFIDDYSRYCWVFPLFQKSEVYSKFVEFYHMVKCQFARTIKILRTDGGGEYINRHFQQFCKQYGLLHQYTCPYTPAQNGIAERKHRHIVETIRSLLLHSSTPHTLWTHALFTAVHLINILPSRTLNNKTPHEILFQHKPTYSHIKTFGCLCYPWLRPYCKTKLGPLSKPCVFIGYASSQKGYHCLDPNTNKIYTSRHVVFTEHIFPYAQIQRFTDPTKTSIRIPPLLLVPASCIPTSTSRISPQHSSSHHQIQQTVTVPSLPPIASDTITVEKPARTHHMTTRSRTGHLKPKTVFNLSHQINPPDPTSYIQASKHPHWRHAMSLEFQDLQSQGTWDLVPPSPHMNVLGCKWMFRTKYNSDGSISRHKARLVALGCNQEYGIDYYETFSPVAKIPTFRILITIALHNSWPIHQLDVSNAFLHGSLNETIYMKQPAGFQDHTYPTYVCKLKKALYGLKQSPRQWFATLTGHLSTLGFGTSHSDPSLLISCKNNIRLYFLIYVDDIIVTGNNTTAVQELLMNLHARFNMRNLGKLSQFLGITAVKTEQGLLLHQQRFAHTILERAGMLNCKPVSTPICTKESPSSSPSPDFANPLLYRQLVGSLQYLTLTRPDIAYAVNRACQYMHKPTDQHFHSLKRILRFIKGSLNFGLPLSRESIILTSYVDSDWAGDHQDRKSTSGYCTFLGNSVVAWSVKKQTTVARSSTEAEYRALASAATEVIWTRTLLQELGHPQSEPTKLYCDNISAIALANNPVFHARTKHIEVDCHFIRECIKNNSINVHHISTKDQIADLFTKALPTATFHHLSNKLISIIPTSVCPGVLEYKNKTRKDNVIRTVD